MYSNSQQTKQEKKTQQVKSKNFSTQGTKLNPLYVEDMILSFKISHQICLLNFTRDIQSRVEVWWWIFVRNAVKCGEKKIIFTAYFVHLFAVNAVNRGELFFFTAFSVAVNFFFTA